jgi:hypothetical protein
MKYPGASIILIKFIRCKILISRHGDQKIKNMKKFQKFLSLEFWSSAPFIFKVKNLNFLTSKFSLISFDPFTNP